MAELTDQEEEISFIIGYHINITTIRTVFRPRGIFFVNNCIYRFEATFPWIVAMAFDVDDLVVVQ
jgi:hypothetical protein